MITAKQEAELGILGLANPDHPMVKFCKHPRKWYAEAMRIAVGLGLHESPPITVLDIGCGFGYFLRVCSDLGHDVKGIDIYNAQTIEATQFLNLVVYIYEVRAFDVLPIILPADLITTFGVNFRRADETYWGVEEYVFLTRDLVRHLKPGGKWVLRPNVPYTWDVEKWIEQVDDFANVRLDGWQFIVRPKESSDVND